MHNCWRNMQATFSLVLNRPQSFSLLEDLGKAFARCATDPLPPCRTSLSAVTAVQSADNTFQPQTAMCCTWRARLITGSRQGHTAAASFCACCRWAPHLYKLLHQSLFTLLLLRPVQKIRCPMLTVSDLIGEYGIK